MKIPYERFIQWTAGPIAILAGWAATQLTQHVGLLGGFGLGHDQIAHAIVVAVTFAVGTGVTYAAHHKYITNVANWWSYQADLSYHPVRSAVVPERPVSELIANVPDPGTDIRPVPAVA